MLFAIPWHDCYLVHINPLPLSFWKFYRLSKTLTPLVLDFHLLVIRELCNKLRKVHLHTLPQIYLYQIAVHLYGTRMDGISVFMIFLHDSFLEYIHHRYTQLAFILQQTICPLFKRKYFLLMNINFQIKQNQVLVMLIFHL